MSSKELKLSITQIIEQINDRTVLEAYYEILKNLLKVQRAQIVGYDSDGESITREDLEQKVVAAKKRIESGQSISNEELKNDFKNW
jgi:hypothetical protein